MAWIGIADRDGPGTLCPIAQAGGDEHYLAAKLTWTDDTSRNTPAGTVIRTGEVFIVSDVSSLPAHDPWHEEAIRCGYGSAIALPLRIEEPVSSKSAKGILGVMSIYAGENAPMFPAELKELLKFAKDIAQGFKMLRVNQERRQFETALRTTLTDTIGAAASAIGKRDLYSAAHQQEVADLSRALGMELGMDDERCEGLYLGSTIYDIGNISIPAEILNRPGQLTSAEFAIVKNHPQAGYEIMSGVNFPWPINEMILQHHERLDGSGYPHGLKDDEIIPEARIVALADVVAAMISHRPYRPSLGIDQTLDQIAEDRGRLFDPDVVDACLELFRHKGFRFGG
jgi:HD-GYP domain-containing protein (c-di-GMP phosphodiesterase class II)